MQCNYLHGYAPEVIVDVASIVPDTFRGIEYFIMTDITGKEYAVTYMSWENGKLTAGCADNF